MTGALTQHSHCTGPNGQIYYPIQQFPCYSHSGRWPIGQQKGKKQWLRTLPQRVLTKQLKMRWKKKWNKNRLLGFLHINAMSEGACLACADDWQLGLCPGKREIDGLLKRLVFIFHHNINWGWFHDKQGHLPWSHVEKNRRIFSNGN